MRHLGIDYGTKKVGLALSDEGGTMGFPHSIIANTPKLVDELITFIDEENVHAVVIGESKDLGGADNRVAKDARALGDALAKKGVAVHYEPEAFTSAEARRARDASVTGRSPKRTDAVDASAAALILTSYLSKHGKR